jgi:hypothetical protein
MGMHGLAQPAASGQSLMMMAASTLMMMASTLMHW